MAARYCSLVFGLLIVVTGATAEPDCVHRDAESVCTLSSTPQRVLLHEDRLVVGAIDNIYSFSTDLTPLDSRDISPSPSRNETCVVFDANQPALCRNFVRVLLPVNETTVLVCGTNAVYPKCRFHQLGNLSAWSYMTAEGQKDVGFSPHSNDTNVALLASNGRFFSSTFFSFRHGQQTIGMAPRPLEGDGTFTVQTPSSDSQWINGHLPVFVSAYEVDDHIYFFAREPSYGYELAGRAEVARAFRVCKNDTGFRLHPGDEALTFLTFQKARLRCRTGGLIPYTYDRLQATFLVHSSDRELALYATFSSPSNGPEGAALCKFSFSDILSVFEDGQYWVNNNGWRLGTSTTFACPGQPGTQRTEQQARTHQLVYNVATAVEPMHSVSGDEFAHVAVDVAEYDGDTLEVVVLGHQSGLITLVVQFRGTVYKDITIRAVSTRITGILTLKYPLSEERQVIFTTDASVQSVRLGRCSLYDTCFKCFDSHDPYCAWDQITRSCVNKLATPTTTTLTDALTSSEDTVVGICGARPTPAPQPPPEQPFTCPYIPTDTPVDPPVDTPSDTPEPGTLGPTDGGDVTVNTSGLDQGTVDEGENIGVIAGATAGGILFGVPVGLVVCYLFFSMFLKKSDKSQSETTSHVTLRVNHNLLERHTPASETRCLEQTQVVHRNPTHKNVNQLDPGEEDDVLTDLPATIHIPHRGLHLQPVPVPRGRTDSTRRLMASESSDVESSLELSTVTSPV